MEKLFDTKVLNRSLSYYEGVKQRVGFPVEDGQALLIHAAGVTFEERQKLLKALQIFCKFDRTPHIKLEAEPDNPYDRFAIKILAATDYDETTGEPKYTHVGYVPRGRCPYCATTLSGKKASSQICPECNQDISIKSPLGYLKIINAFITSNLDNIWVGLDSITSSASGNSLGLDFWVRILPK